MRLPPRCHCVHNWLPPRPPRPVHLTPLLPQEPLLVLLPPHYRRLQPRPPWPATRLMLSLLGARPPPPAVGTRLTLLPRLTRARPLPPLLPRVPLTHALCMTLRALSLLTLLRPLPPTLLAAALCPYLPWAWSLWPRRQLLLLPRPAALPLVPPPQVPLVSAVSTVLTRLRVLMCTLMRRPVLLPSVLALLPAPPRPWPSRRLCLPLQLPCLLRRQSAWSRGAATRAMVWTAAIANACPRAAKRCWLASCSRRACGQCGCLPTAIASRGRWRARCGSARHLRRTRRARARPMWWSASA